MRSHHLISLLFIGLLALAAGFLIIPTRLATAQPAQVPGTTRVAIVNPAHVFNEMAETKALRETLEVKRKGLLAQEEQMRNDINTLMGQRAQINPHHPEFLKKSREIDEAKAKLQSWGLATKAGVDRDQKEMLINLYAKIEAAVSAIATKNGIDLVLSDGRSDMAGMEDAPAEDVRRQLNSRNILFATNGVDLTEQVITLLDTNYNKGGVAGPGPGALPPPIR